MVGYINIRFRLQNEENGVFNSRVVVLNENFVEDQPIAKNYGETNRIEVVHNKMESLNKNNTWILMLPENKSIFDCKQIFKVKVNGGKNRYKGRLLVQDYTKKHKTG